VSLIYLLLMIMAALGGGSLLLRGSGLIGHFPPREIFTLAFALGVGLIGWVVFFLALAGFIEPFHLVAVLAVLALGSVFLIPIVKGQGGQRDAAAVLSDLPGDIRVRALLWLGVALVLSVDVMEGLAPPADGDSLAYHFALPKSFLAAGGLFPVYQAIEGAIPLMQQMTYLAALGIGGEGLMTLWTMATGWGAAWLMYVIARRFLSTNWSLAVTLVFLCTPAVTYSAGSGHIEVRNAMFVLAAVLFAAEARRSGDFRLALLAGIAASFFIASKYTGLIFAFACGCMLLFHKRWLAHGLAFGAALLIFGSQWYFWNFANTGDPVFPLLFGTIDYPAHVPWDADIHEAYRSTITEKPLPANIFWLFGYPLKAILDAHPAFESLRVGFGPATLMLLPFSVIGFWIYREQVFRHPLFIFGGACLITYAIWFLFGPSQRLRHLLPVYPLLLICFSVAAVKAADRFPGFSAPLKTAFFAVIGIQIAGAGVLAMNYATYHLSGQDREQFLLRNVSEYDAVVASMPHLSSDDRVVVSSRQLVYLFDVPVFYANPMEQAVIAIHGKVRDPEGLWRQLQDQKISHILLPFELNASPAGGTPYQRMANILLLKHQCLTVIEKISATAMVSRTLPLLGRQKNRLTLVRLTPQTCTYQ